MRSRQKDFPAYEAKVGEEKKERGCHERTIDRERSDLLFGCLSRLFSGPTTCPPELTPGNSPIDSLEMSIGDLEQEFARGRGRGECRAFLSRVGRVYVHLHRYAYVARMRPAGPWSDFLRGARASETDPPIACTKTISPGDDGDLVFCLVAQHPDLAQLVDSRRVTLPTLFRASLLRLNPS